MEFVGYFGLLEKRVEEEMLEVGQGEDFVKEEEHFGEGLAPHER